jgi:hypothetical protein
MKRLILAAVLSFSFAGYPHMMGEMKGGKEGHGSMGMMMMMMQDPELRKIIMEHRRKCMRELMEKISARPSFQERLIRMLLKHPDAAKQVLEENPDLKKGLEELLK